MTGAWAVDMRPCPTCGVMRKVRTGKSLPKTCMSCRGKVRKPPGDWSSMGACRNGSYDPELWWPVSEGTLLGAQAKAICQRLCPVRRACLSHALNQDEREGIWGGYEPSERQALKAKRKRALTEAC